MPKEKKKFHEIPLGSIPSKVTLDVVLSSLKWHEFSKLSKSVQALGGPEEEEVAWKHYYEQRYLGQHPKEGQSYKDAFAEGRHLHYVTRKGFENAGIPFFNADIFARVKADKEFMLYAVKIDGLAIQYASDEIKRDKDVASAAVKKDWRALLYLPAEVKCYEAVAVAAVKQKNWGFALRNLPDEVKRKEAVAVAAVQQDWHALYDLPDEMKKNNKVAMAAVKQDWRSAKDMFPKTTAAAVGAMSIGLGIGLYAALRSGIEVAMAYPKESKSALITAGGLLLINMIERAPEVREAVERTSQQVFDGFKTSLSSLTGRDNEVDESDANLPGVSG
ncbi:MAG: DUF4116 domain-containing protein [Gammaproteobacteria bacterium]|nr:DUF4116 domain-containing protein [Gammaproteobacteria bacterium]MCH9717500.1 DUF4116 domain-containing protein [Gammaproteobacteria bacterium]MCH9763390.1 DUF4116 domain-containing protein [Gammaproteobacteria bacterium]